jgi:hypothetical protein
LTLSKALKNEFRLTYRCLEKPDFYEVRCLAALGQGAEDIGQAIASDVDLLQAATGVSWTATRPAWATLTRTALHGQAGFITSGRILWILLITSWLGVLALLDCCAPRCCLGVVTANVTKYHSQAEFYLVCRPMKI